MRQHRAFNVLALLGIFAFLLLVVGLVMLTRQMDQAQFTRERTLLSAQIDANVQIAANSVVTAARNDEAIRRLDHARDPAWGAMAFPHAPEAQVWAYTFARDDEFISGRHGQASPSSTLARLETALPRRIAALRKSGAYAGPKASMGMADFFWHERRLYFLMTVPFSPASSMVKLKHENAPILAAVTPYDEFVRTNLVGTGLKNLQITREPVAGTAGKAVADARGRSIATITWRLGQPGADLLRLVLGPVLALGGAFVALLAFTHRRAVAEQRKLVESEARANYLAFHDPLTELANRRCFLDELGCAVASAKATGTELAILLIDLDRFKLINDTYGHQCGDELILEASRRLRSACSAGELCARLGGDEFVILATHCDASAASALAERILGLLSESVQLSLAKVQAAASIGVTVFRGEGDPDNLMRHADLALYRAKDQGRNTFRFFETEMDQALELRRQLEHDLRATLVQNDLHVAYQPIYEGGQLVSLEALARWTHLERGPIAPDFFIPLAEECGLAAEVGTQIIRRAFRDSHDWPTLRVAMNLTPAQLRAPDFLPELVRAMVEERVNPERFEFELTETALLADDASTRETLAALRKLGFRLGLGDFGSGYSGLDYLRRFPIDRIKIDRSLVASLNSDKIGTAAVRALVRLARTLGIEVTADGVETYEQQQRLIALGCQSLQGYLFGRPVTAGEIAPLLSPRVAA